MTEDVRTIEQLRAADDANWAALQVVTAERNRLRRLLEEVRATLEMWKDVAPAVSLCKDIDDALRGRLTGVP